MSVLVVSWDRVGERMAGSAVRALEMARSLARSGQEVVLAAPDGSRCEPLERLALVCVPGERALRDLIAACEVVVLSGRIELMTAIRKPLVVDLYDPFILSNLDLFGDDFARSRGKPLLGLRWLQHHLAHGDFFLCASPAQRGFWLGMLAAAGRVNRANYEADPELRGLLDVVPFGVPDEPPQPGPPVLKGVLPGIGAADRVVLWAGGMWNWVDPLTLVRAAALLRERRPEVKTVVLGTRHPNPEIGEMAIARRAIDLARELGVLDRGISFVDWVPYEERQRWVLESDVGVSLHRRGVESELAFRTRVLDYLWGLLPMVLTVGDDLAARVEREDLGRVVAPEDPVAVAAAIEALLDDPAAQARTARLAAARESFAWSRAVEPLRRFCAAPRHASDHDGRAWLAADTPREGLVRKEEAQIAEEFVSEARAISPPLDAECWLVQRFRAAYDHLCQIDVLLWVEPPVEGWNLVLELHRLGPLAERVARVVVPAPLLPHCDWQRFELEPLPGTRGCELELRLSVVPAAGHEDAAPAGRVCVWRCAPPPGAELSGDGVAFIVRYLIAGVAEQMPVSRQDFLFAHGTTVPLGEGADPSLPVALAEAPGEGGAPVDVERLRADLARVAAQSAEAERRVLELERALEARIAQVASAAARDEIANGSLAVALLQRVVSGSARLVRFGMRVAVRAIVLLLALASVPLALCIALVLAACDGLAWLGRRRSGDPAAASCAPHVSSLPAPSHAGSLGPAAALGGALAAAPPPAQAEAGPAAASAAAIERGSSVSIVVPTWNGRELLEMSLPPLIEAVRRHGDPRDEILVVDNGSDDDTLELLARLARQAPELRTVALDRNHMFAGAANRGARAAANPVLILLNNDMVVEPDFVQPLIDAFVAEPSAFGVSCQIDFMDPSKPRWETGKVHARLERGQVRLFHLDRFDEDLLYPIFFAGGGASAYDRERFLALGGFDEAVFSPIYIEDADLGYRAWKRGWPSLLAPRARVHHKHRSTTRRVWSEGTIHGFFVKNLAALLWKNASSWRLLGRHLASLPALPMRVRREHGGRAALATAFGLARQLPHVARARLAEARAARVLSDAEVFHLSRYRHALRARLHREERDPSGRPQVLIVSPYSPVPAVHGGATRMRNLIREVGSRCDVTLVSFYDTEAEARPESLVALRELCRDAVLVPRDLHSSGGRLAPWSTFGFHSQRMFEEVEAWLDRRHFDVVQVEYTHMAGYLPPPSPGLRRVLVEHDVAFVAVARSRARAAARRRRWALWLDGLRTLRHEVAAVDGADRVVTMSEADRATLARLVDPARLAVVPNGVSCADFPFREQPPEPATVLFVGFFRHEPNVEAVLHLVREVLPRLRERVPQVRVQVVGAYPPAELVALAADEPTVELAGMVPETAPFYRGASVFLAPILRGSGTRLKILEAMASGCAVVSTTIGAEGLEAGPREIRIADGAEALAAATAALILDPERREAQALAARRFVEQRYDWPEIARRQLEVWGLGDAPPEAARREPGGQGAQGESGVAGVPEEAATAEISGAQEERRAAGAHGAVRR